MSTEDKTKTVYIDRDVDLVGPTAFICVFMLIAAWISSYRDVRIPNRDEIRQEVCKELNYYAYVDGRCANIERY